MHPRAFWSSVKGGWMHSWSQNSDGVGSEEGREAHRALAAHLFYNIYYDSKVTGFGAFHFTRRQTFFLNLSS